MKACGHHQTANQYLQHIQCCILAAIAAQSHHVNHASLSVIAYCVQHKGFVTHVPNAGPKSRENLICSRTTGSTVSNDGTDKHSPAYSAISKPSSGYRCQVTWHVTQRKAEADARLQQLAVQLTPPNHM
jgi:hypothetical protein